MKTPLTKISKDLSVDPLLRHGVYIRQYKNTTNKLFINDGHLMRLYKYPNIKRKFFSPKINDYNLHLCGGWAFRGINGEEAIIRVITNLKPMGFFITTAVKKWEAICKKSELPYIITPNHIPTEKHFNIGISCSGTFGDNFDLQNLAIDYVTHANKVKTPLSAEKIEKIENFISSLKNTAIASYLTSDYANPYSTEELIITGLILGYPIETTVSILWME